MNWFSSDRSEIILAFYSELSRGSPSPYLYTYCPSSCSVSSNFSSHSATATHLSDVPGTSLAPIALPLGPAVLPTFQGLICSFSSGLYSKDNPVIPLATRTSNTHLFCNITYSQWDDLYIILPSSFFSSECGSLGDSFVQLSIPVTVPGTQKVLHKYLLDVGGMRGWVEENGSWTWEPEFGTLKLYCK